jgi:hypothetical protein
MIRGIVGLGSLVVAGMIAIACGGTPKPADAPAQTTAAGAPASSAPAPSASGAAPTAAAAPSSSSGSWTSTPLTPVSPAGSASAGSAAPPPAHPFAKNAVEATSMIDDAINSKANELTACVEDARKRRKDPHAKIVVQVGIDENGRLIGVEMPKGEKKDKALSDCLLQALHGAPFPESHAGVITVRKTFEDKAVYR